MLGDQASNADRVVAKVCALALASLEACNDNILCSKSVQLHGLPLSEPSASTYCPHTVSTAHVKDAIAGRSTLNEDT